jgi:hypothetical protein
LLFKFVAFQCSAIPHSGISFNIRSSKVLQCSVDPLCLVKKQLDLRRNPARLSFGFVVLSRFCELIVPRFQFLGQVWRKAQTELHAEIFTNLKFWRENRNNAHRDAPHLQLARSVKHDQFWRQNFALHAFCRHFESIFQVTVLTRYSFVQASATQNGPTHETFKRSIA